MGQCGSRIDGIRNCSHVVKVGSSYLGAEAVISAGALHALGAGVRVWLMCSFLASFPCKHASSYST